MMLAVAATVAHAGDNVYVVKKSGAVEEFGGMGSGRLTFSEPTGGLFAFTLNSTEGPDSTIIKGKFGVKINDEAVKAFSPSKMEVGVVYSPFGNPTYERDGKMRLGKEMNTYDFTIHGLEKGVTYTWRPYVKVFGKVYYGDSLRVATVGDARTLSRKVTLLYTDWGGDDPYNPGPTTYYSLTIDRYNLGSSSEGDPGDYYAWGEITPKDEYTWDNYKWSDGTTATKYRAVANSDHLEDADDAVLVVTHGECYMMRETPRGVPTKEERQIEYYYTKTWTTRIAPDGSTIHGLEIKGTLEDKVFFPAGGYYDGTTLVDYDKEVTLWEKQTWGYRHQGDDESSYAYAQSVRSTADNIYITDDKKHYRYLGLPLRGLYGATERDAD